MWLRRKCVDTRFGKTFCCIHIAELRPRGANRKIFITCWKKSVADVNFHKSVDFSEAMLIYRS